MIKIDAQPDCGKIPASLIDGPTRRTLLRLSFIDLPVRDGSALPWLQ